MTLFPSLFETRRPQPRPVEAAIQVDFTGGINPCSNETKLAPTEVKEACNVDFLTDGGICRRNAFHPFGADFLSEPCSDPICYEDAEGNSHFIVELENGSIVDIVNGPIIGYFSNDQSSYTSSLGWNLPGDCKLTGCEVCGNLYVTKGDGWYRWDGTTLVPVDKGFREDQFEDTELPNFAQFCQTGIPCGQECIVWDSRFWVARTTIRRPLTEPTFDQDEKGNQVKTGEEPLLDATGCQVYEEEYDCSGLYYSFAFGPGDQEGPEDFFAEWNYRLKTSGNDCIVKMVAAGTRMYVFQQNSITMFEPFFGEPSTIPYQLFSYSTGVGAAGSKACCVDGNGIWFFDAEQGLMRINPEGQLETHFDKMRCILTDGTLDQDQTGAAVGCCNGRVWLSLKTMGAERNDVTYVYNPQIGAWTLYKQGFICFKDYQPTGISPEPCGEQEQRPSFCLGLVWDPCPNVVILDQEVPCESNMVDDFGYFKRPIESSVTTGWFDAGVSEAVKDWCGFEMIFQGSADQSMQVDGFGDWNPCFLTGSHELEIGHPKAGAKAGFINDKLNLGPILLECNVNDPTPEPRLAFRDEGGKPILGVEDKLPISVRMGKMCASRSLCLKFSPSGDGKWNLCRLAMFFKRKPVRC